MIVLLSYYFKCFLGALGGAATSGDVAQIGVQLKDRQTNLVHYGTNRYNPAKTKTFKRQTNLVAEVLC